MVRPGYKTETDFLHSVATDPHCRWLWTRHAPERMRERGITAPDVQHVLMNGHVELVERKTDDVWRVKGKDLDGRTLIVACVVFGDTIAIRVVTVF